MIRRQKRRRTKFSKRVVVGLLIAVAAFTIAVLGIFLWTGNEPSTLIMAFFSFAGGEAGVLGIIKYSDNRSVPGEEKDTDEEMKG